jgi:5-methylcytosine-specific restriction endonuclease McrA
VKGKLENLKAAAAANSRAQRIQAESVKQQLARSPFCPYCAAPIGADPHVDHIYPISKGGRSVSRNMVFVCSACSTKKGDLTLAGFTRKFGLHRDEIERRLLDLGKDV